MKVTLTCLIDILVKQKRLNAAIRDCTLALELNPDSAKAMKIRGSFKLEILCVQASTLIQANRTAFLGTGRKLRRTYVVHVRSTLTRVQKRFGKTVKGNLKNSVVI